MCSFWRQLLYFLAFFLPVCLSFVRSFFLSSFLPFFLSIFLLPLVLLFYFFSRFPLKALWTDRPAARQFARLCHYANGIGITTPFLYIRYDAVSRCLVIWADRLNLHVRADYPNFLAGFLFETDKTVFYFGRTALKRCFCPPRYDPDHKVRFLV